MQGCKLLVLFVGLFSLTGCVLLEKKPAKNPPLGPVYQVHTYWNREVMQVNEGSGTSMPGLGGRVYLFGPELKHPVGAEGQAKFKVEMTYLRPDRQPQRIEWEFPKKYLDQLLSQDLLGWGYTLPLPWREYHPSVQHVSIRVTYVPEKGSPIVGNPSSFTLQQLAVQATSSTIVPENRITKSSSAPTNAAQGMASPGR